MCAYAIATAMEVEAAAAVARRVLTTALVISASLSEAIPLVTGRLTSRRDAPTSGNGEGEEGAGEADLPPKLRTRPQHAPKMGPKRWTGRITPESAERKTSSMVSLM